jgi:antitoxin (DNA-binding transcriptional repressor) of toxin-antitoxin stability system
MIKVGIKALLHNFAEYKDRVKKGERIVVLEHQKPILDITAHSEHISKPGWKHAHFVLPKTKKTAADVLLKMRQEERN